MERNLLSDFPSGPLDRYRKTASFDWKKMKILIETEEMIKYNEKIVKMFQEHVYLHPSTTPLSLDEERNLAAKRMRWIEGSNLPIFPKSNVREPNVVLKNMFSLDPATSIKYSASYGLCVYALTILGTERHQRYLEEVLKKKYVGSFCLTEIGHGTNTKGMRTTATYDPSTQEFILNNPDFESAKCWAANLGQSSTYAIVYAQLYTPDGKCHGLHAFVANIRDKKTLKPYGGVIVGDMGAKAGLNGVDNGFLMFKNYRIPRENLLNKTSDVSPEGEYVPVIKDPSKRFAMSIGGLSSGRANIIFIGVLYLERVLTVAIRYAAVRKQFGPKNKEEMPIIEYQLHQWRLFPYLATCYVYRIFADFITQTNYQLNIDLLAKKDIEKLSHLGFEIHILSSAGKSVIGWVVRDAIQECREACGGHGYLKASQISDIRNDHDANCTYEGENHVLCQQTSNWLVKLWPLILNDMEIPETPLNSIHYFSDAKKILQSKFTANTVEEAVDPINIMKAYKWLVCFLLKESHEKLQALSKEGVDAFTAKNNSQVFYLRSLSIVYIEHFMIEKMFNFAQSAQDSAVRPVLMRLLSLHGAWSLDKHMSILYQGGYANGTAPARLIKQGILDLCEKIKPDAVALVDAVAPHDFYMTSPLGKSDGQVYKHLEAQFFAAPGTFSRPEWWQDIIDGDLHVYKNKL